MSKAFRCEICGEFFDGNPDMQVGLDKQGETILRHILGIKFSPEMNEAMVYLKDLCNKCTQSFCGWYRNRRAKLWQK